jgi:hypothetical protein
VIDEVVPSPTIVCSDGSDFDATAFATTDAWIAAEQPNNWKTGGYTSYSTEGKSVYGVSGKCGGVEAEAASCTELTITATPIATCVFNPASYEAGQEVSVDVKCTGGAAPGGNQLFSKVSGNEATGFANWAIGGVATYATAGKSQYKVSGVKCNDIDVDDATCNEITITAPTITCKWANPYKGGAAIPAPAITCDNGKTDVVATGAGVSFSYLSGHQVTTPSSWATAGGSTASPLATANATGTYKVSGVTCGGYAAAEANCALSITPSPTATCNFATDSYILGQTVAAPTVGCSAGTTTTDVSARAFSTSGTALVNNTTAWVSTAIGTSTYKVSGVKCDSISVADKDCNALTIKPVPTATCTWATKTYNIGANVGAPTIGCSDGAVDKSGATFTKVSGVDAKAPANWKATTNANTYYETSGTSLYKVSGVKCGTYTAAVAEANCDTLKINPVTCAASGIYRTGAAIAAPAISGCDSPGSLAYSPTFSNTVGPQPVTLTSVTCGSNNVAVTNLACGNVTITAAPTCDAYTSNVAGKTWNDICNGVDWDDVQWNVRPVAGSKGCFYVQNLTGDWGPGAPHRVNGTAFAAGNGTNRANAAATKIDGGVYIWIGDYSNTYMHNANNVTPGSDRPFCAGGPAPTLTCALGSASMLVTDNPASILPSVLSCSDGSVPGTPAWVNAPNMAITTAQSSLSASAVCGGAPVNATCSGTLTVQATPTCDAYTGNNTAAGKTWDDICPNTQWSAVKWNTKPTNNTAGCYYVQSVSGDINMNGSPNSSCYFRTNGTCRSGQVSGSTLGIIDGGVYIYVPSGTGWNNGFSVTEGTQPPFCVDKVHALYCNAPSSLADGIAVNPSGYVTCRSGDAPTNISWAGAPAWSAPVAGSFPTSVSASCGSTSFSNISCGTITVSAPTAVNIGSNSNNGATLNAGTIYEVTFTATSGGAFRCPNASVQNTTVGTYDGQTLYIRDGGNRILSLNNTSNLPRPAVGTKVIIAPSVNLGSCYWEW